MTTSEQTSTSHRLAERAMWIMSDGTPDDFVEVVHPDAHNREAATEPLACRGSGPAAFLATAHWLRGAFSELHFDVHEVVVQDDLLVTHVTMSGRHTGPMTAHGPDGRPTQVFPPTGRRFAATQSHWMRVRDGQVIEHWANRDDMGTGQQLGWLPPSPWYLVRTLLATRRARRQWRRPPG